jgi:hypothetical protein
MPVFTTAIRLGGALLATLPAGGCCTLAKLFCGPDKSRWVAQDFSTPQAALATFLEAIRRDQPIIIHKALSEAAKQRHGVTGIVESTIAWERLKREVTGLHLAGEADVGQPVRETDRRMRYDLAVAGQTLTVRLVEQAFWSLSYTQEGSDELEQAGRFVPASALRKMLVLQGTDEPGVAALVRDGTLPELTPAQLRELRIGYMWKVDELVGLARS